ncbi:MAG: hypothetical protein ACKOWF_01490 [Chloroflexota bacterium]
MSTFLVIRETRDDDGAVRPPSRLEDLARASLARGGGARWVRTWSPDAGDDRIFSLWEAESAAQIEAALERYGFLDDMEATPLRVSGWGPEEVLAAGVGE